MTAPVSKEQLLAARLPEEDIPIEGLGTVRARALSRDDVVRKLQGVDRSVPGAFERRLLSLALVAPSLTEDEVEVWQQSSIAAELDTVINRINVMSGLAKDAAKEAWKEMESNPDAEFRVPAGGEAGDDGQPSP